MKTLNACLIKFYSLGTSFISPSSQPFILDHVNKCNILGMEELLLASQSRVAISIITIQIEGRGKVGGHYSGQQP